MYEKKMYRDGGYSCVKVKQMDSLARGAAGRAASPAHSNLLFGFPKIPFKEQISGHELSKA
jgi:hypothetical protein